MRTLIILVCTVNMMLTGCKMASKTTSCCATSACGQACGCASDGDSCAKTDGCCKSEEKPCAATGCTTGNGCGKNGACASKRSCAETATCGAHGVKCGVAHIAIKPEATQVAQKPEPKQVIKTNHEEIEQPKKEDVKNPFEEVEAKVEAKPAPSELPVPEYGHGKRYEWLLGKLQRVHSPKHTWKIRFAGLDEHDTWGGSMVLAQDQRLDQYKDGDAVYIEGEVLTERPSVYLTGGLYRARQIRPASEVTHIIPRVGK